MRIGELDEREFGAAIQSRGVRVRIGPFTALIRGEVSDFASTLHRCYASYPCVLEDTVFSDARIDVERPRRFFAKRDANRAIRLNSGNIYTQFPAGSELPYIEWGMNLCIATTAHQYLMLHAAVLAKDGAALLLPGLPGSGKSTLCAYLMHNGWRLLSDEFTLIRGSPPTVQPFPRLVALKNESIDIIRQHAPEAIIGPSFPGTAKGTVAHVCPPAPHVARMHETATPKLIVFPCYVRDRDTELIADTKPRTFVELTKHAFNYILRGHSAFESTTRLVDEVDSYRLIYSDLLEAKKAIDDVFVRSLASA